VSSTCETAARAGIGIELDVNVSFYNESRGLEREDATCMKGDSIKRGVRITYERINV